MVGARQTAKTGPAKPIAIFMKRRLERSHSMTETDGQIALEDDLNYKVERFGKDGFIIEDDEDE